MRDLVHLLPGSQLPTWVEHLEREVFTDPWGPLEAHEHLLGYPSCAYARWSVLPAAGEAELLRLAVAPAERRQGLARRLLEDSEAFLAQAGVGLVAGVVCPRCWASCFRHRSRIRRPSSTSCPSGAAMLRK